LGLYALRPPIFNPLRSTSNLAILGILAPAVGYLDCSLTNGLRFLYGCHALI
jgi:hypothetical protein